jgi:hypothetical protein
MGMRKKNWGREIGQENLGTRNWAREFGNETRAKIHRDCQHNKTHFRFRRGLCSFVFAMLFGRSCSAFAALLQSIISIVISHSLARYALRS